MRSSSDSRAICCRSSRDQSGQGEALAGFQAPQSLLLGGGAYLQQRSLGVGDKNVCLGDLDVEGGAVALVLAGFGGGLATRSASVWARSSSVPGGLHLIGLIFLDVPGHVLGGVSEVGHGVLELRQGEHTHLEEVGQLGAGGRLCGDLPFQVPELIEIFDLLGVVSLPSERRWPPVWA